MMAAQVTLGSEISRAESDGQWLTVITLSGDEVSLQARSRDQADAIVAAINNALGGKIYDAP